VCPETNGTAHSHHHLGSDPYPGLPSVDTLIVEIDIIPKQCHSLTSAHPRQGHKMPGRLKMIALYRS